MRRTSIGRADPIPLLVASPPCRSLERVWPDRAEVTPDGAVGRRPAAPAGAAGRGSARSWSPRSTGARRSAAPRAPLGGPADLQMLLALRTAADALLVGPGTVRAEGYGAAAEPGGARLALVRPAVGGRRCSRRTGQRVLVYTRAERRAAGGRRRRRDRAAWTSLRRAVLRRPARARGGAAAVRGRPDAQPRAARRRPARRALPHALAGRRAATSAPRDRRRRAAGRAPLDAALRSRPPTATSTCATACRFRAPCRSREPRRSSPAAPRASARRPRGGCARGGRAT